MQQCSPFFMPSFYWFNFFKTIKQGCKMCKGKQPTAQGIYIFSFCEIYFDAALLHCCNNKKIYIYNMSQPVYYSNYLALDKILNAQHLESTKNGEPAHDEMLFIVIHQAYELWFKQVLFELDDAISILSQEKLNDNAADLQTVVHRFKRIVTILKVLVQQVDIMETMTPLEFLAFRDALRPASGFQSVQFKIIEAKLGLQFEERFGQHYYTSQLTEKDVASIKEVEAGKNVLQLLNTWLERMPFFDNSTAWQNFDSNATGNLHEKNTHPFWRKYQHIFNAALAEAEQKNAAHFATVCFDEEQERRLSAKACRAALFIKLYRGYPMLELPFQLLDTLLEVDNMLGNWRYRHMNMVRRMIGTRIGTGGSTGAGYLQGAMDKHYIFREVAQLNSFLINRKQLPNLPQAISAKLGYTI
jgi:tryptophan 2,3-dioxygenase